MLNTPVLFLVFNRPDTTKQVFEAIRKAQPKQLFVAADGPRPDKPGEKEKTEEVRRIATAVDWDCELKTLFRDENLGCGRGPATAITWFFENVEQGIILEDDCLPDQSFFPYCEELLNKYKHNNEVMVISGTNLLNKTFSHDSYFFSSYAGIWGWATWQRAWEKFDYSVPEWDIPAERKKVLDSLKEDVKDNFVSQLSKIKNGILAAWDYQWWFYRIYNNSIGIVPNINLIRNIGFGPDATHTFDPESILANIPIKSIKFPLLHPLKISLSSKYDQSYLKLLFGKQNNLLKKIRNRISFK